MSGLSNHSHIFVITGIPGAGKTTFSSALLRHFPLGLHIPTDDIRDWVVSGASHPLPVWTSETTRQFRLAHQASGMLARLYACAGFTIAIEHVMFPEDIQNDILPYISEFNIHKIFLNPVLEIALARNATRGNKKFDASILTDLIRERHQVLTQQIASGSDWLVLDNSDLSVDQTVNRVLTLLQLD